MEAYFTEEEYKKYSEFASMDILKLIKETRDELNRNGERFESAITAMIQFQSTAIGTTKSLISPQDKSCKQTKNSNRFTNPGQFSKDSHRPSNTNAQNSYECRQSIDVVVTNDLPTVEIPNGNKEDVLSMCSEESNMQAAKDALKSSAQMWQDCIRKTNQSPSPIKITEKKDFTSKGRKKKGIAYFLPKIGYPRLSRLTKEEQKLYMILFNKYAVQMHSPQNLEETRERHHFKELHAQVVVEQEEFMNYLQDVAHSHCEDYQYVQPKALQYVEQLVKDRMGRVKEYPRYYVNHDTVSITAPKVPSDVPFYHLKTLLNLGTVPNLRRMLGNEKHLRVLYMEYDNVDKHIPANSHQLYNKKSCSKDDVCKKLTETHSLDVVVSSSALNCLVNNHGQFLRQWELPFDVREVPVTNSQGQTRVRKVVFIDKPFIPKHVTPREQKTQYCKYALKARYLYPLLNQAHFRMSDKEPLRYENLNVKVKANSDKRRLNDSFDSEDCSETSSDESCSSEETEEAHQIQTEKLQGTKVVDDEVFEPGIEDLETFGTRSTNTFRPKYGTTTKNKEHKNKVKVFKTEHKPEHSSDTITCTITGPVDISNLTVSDFTSNVGVGDKHENLPVDSKVSAASISNVNSRVVPSLNSTITDSDVDELVIASDLEEPSDSQVPQVDGPPDVSKKQSLRRSSRLMNSLDGSLQPEEDPSIDKNVNSEGGNESVDTIKPESDVTSSGTGVGRRRSKRRSQVTDAEIVIADSCVSNDTNGGKDKGKGLEKDTEKTTETEASLEQESPDVAHQSTAQKNEMKPVEDNAPSKNTKDHSSGRRRSNRLAKIELEVKNLGPETEDRTNEKQEERQSSSNSGEQQTNVTTEVQGNSDLEDAQLQTGEPDNTETEDIKMDDESDLKPEDSTLHEVESEIMQEGAHNEGSNSDLQLKEEDLGLTLSSDDDNEGNDGEECDVDDESVEERERRRQRWHHRVVPLPASDDEERTEDSNAKRKKPAKPRPPPPKSKQALNWSYVKRDTQVKPAIKTKPHSSKSLLIEPLPEALLKPPVKRHTSTGPKYPLPKRALVVPTPPSAGPVMTDVHIHPATHQRIRQAGQAQNPILIANNQMGISQENAVNCKIQTQIQKDVTDAKSVEASFIANAPPKPEYIDPVAKSQRQSRVVSSNFPGCITSKESNGVNCASTLPGNVLSNHVEVQGLAADLSLQIPPENISVATPISPVENTDLILSPDKSTLDRDRTKLLNSVPKVIPLDKESDINNIPDMPTDATPNLYDERYDVKTTNPTPVVKRRRESNKPKSFDVLGGILETSVPLFETFDSKSVPQNDRDGPYGSSTLQHNQPKTQGEILATEGIQPNSDNTMKEKAGAGRIEASVENTSTENVSQPQASSESSVHYATNVEHLYSASSSQRDPHEWLMYENPKNFQQPIQGNATYNVWQIGRKRVLIRCGYHAYTRPRQASAKDFNFVHLQPKLEYQLQYGYEQLTAEEISKAWLNLAIRHRCKLQRVHINAGRNQLHDGAYIVNAEEVDLQQLLQSAPMFNPQAPIHILSAVFDKLCSLPVGHYLLSHASGNAHAHIKKTTQSRTGVYDLVRAHENRTVDETSVPLVPLDPRFPLKFHTYYNRVPCTFEPKDSNYVPAGFYKKFDKKQKGKGKNKNKSK